VFSLFKYQRNKWFWKLRYYFNNTILYINGIFFKQRENIKQYKERFYTTKELIEIIAPSFFYAFFVVVALEVVENTLLNFLSISKPLFIRNILDYLFLLHNRLIISVNSLETLLSIVASISGIFLGLYFTAISVVASSVFARVPSNLRELLLKEKVGNQYIKILALLTSISILLLGYIAFGGFPGFFISLFILLLECFGIFCFVVLGIRVFSFFDPTRLSDTIFYDLNSIIRLSTINGFKWADPNFQSHYQKNAARDISTLSTLIKLCINEPQLQKQPLSIILIKIAFFLKNYEQQRALIPTDSYWYALVPRYKSWFLCDSSTLATALETQTSIQPEMVPNTHWLEDNIVEILLPTFEQAFQKENLEIVYEALNENNIYLESLGFNLEFKKGQDMINRIGQPIEKYFNTSSLDKGEYRDIELALFDAYGLTTISLTLGFYKLIINSTLQNILKAINSVNWFNAKSIYQNGIVPPILPRMEFIQKRMKFEKLVERKRISPDWYTKQLIIMRYAELFQETVNEILLALEEFFVAKSSFLLSKGFFILAAHHSQRGLELCNKIRVHSPVLKTLTKELEKMVINKDLPWPAWDWSQINDKVDNSHDKLVENLANCIPSLSLIEHREKFPDLFGQAYNIVCQDCYESMILKKANKFKNIFPLLFFGSFKAYERLTKTIKDLQPDPRLIISLDPLIDIMELSGYAKIYSELFDIPEIWNVCGETWNKYFDSSDNSENRVKFLVKFYEYRKGLFQISQRDILRSNWQIGLNDKLQGMDLIDDMFSSSRLPWEKNMKNKHKSLLIRALCRGRHELLISAAEVFIITYLLKRPESQGIEFKDMREISKAIEKEQNNDNKEDI
jgi:hypothetical protein